MALFAGLSLVPDLDYVGVMAGIADGGPCGHRGATHSLVPAIVAAVLGAAIAGRFRIPRWRLALLAGVTMLSHPLLDAMTIGGRGVPLLWPFSFTRFALPWQPIPDSPCGLAYLSLAGLRVAAIEAVIFLPILVLALRPTRRSPAEPANPQAPGADTAQRPVPARITRQTV